MRQLTIAAFTASVMFAGAASAADMPIKAPVPAPLPVSDWTGIYFGGEGGYGWGKQNTDAVSSGDLFALTITQGATFALSPPVFYPDLAIPSIKQKGWLAGGFFGVQKQWGNWVLGIEGDIDAADIKGSGTSNAGIIGPNTITLRQGLTTLTIGCGPGVPCYTLDRNLSISSKIDALASLRGKVGLSFSPNWMVYGTGGAALAHVENTLISTNSATFAAGVCPPNACAFPSGSLSTSGDTTLFGWAAGGGIDWKLPLNAGSALVFGVEYLHYGFPERTIALSDNAGGGRSFRASQDIDVVKGRISYLFSLR